MTAPLCRCCFQKLAAPGLWQCSFCIYVDPSAERKARLDDDLVALAGVGYRVEFRLRMARGRQGVADAD